MTRILFNSDDFGRTSGINAAVIQAHQQGVLGSASLMVTGEAFQEAVDLAKKNPSLKVGLHLALSEARSSLPANKIPLLVEKNGCFNPSPAVMGIRMAICPKTRKQAVAEIESQFETFIKTGLIPAHVDGHHHLHMHPFVFEQCVRLAEKHGFPRIRIACEFGNPLPPRRDSQGFTSKWIRHFIFRGLSQKSRRRIANSPVKVLNGVLGLWETGRMSEDYLLRTIPLLPQGDWEVYSHVGSPDSPEELPALLSPTVKELLSKLHIERL